MEEPEEQRKSEKEEFRCIKVARGAEENEKRRISLYQDCREDRGYWKKKNSAAARSSGIQRKSGKEEFRCSKVVRNTEKIRKRRIPLYQDRREDRENREQKNSAVSRSPGIQRKSRKVEFRCSKIARNTEEIEKRRISL